MVLLCSQEIRVTSDPWPPVGPPPVDTAWTPLSCPWASDTVRASVRDQLAPLEKLGPARADTAIRTLAAYLDEQGSVVRTAERLHLHRNAVTNRLRSITELLDVDLDDPDQRLALQLACRARLLG
jgi:DNA-binding PucR family transcriptional regulator